MLRIGVDIDGTIKYTQRAAVRFFNEALKKQVNVDDVRTFYLDEPYGLDRQESKRLWRKLQAKIYAVGLPREHAATVLTQAEADGHAVFFVTARPGMPHIRKITEEWLSKHGFPFNNRNLHMDARNKAAVANKLALDLFFDDAPDHLDRLIAAGIPTVIVDAVYNRDYHPGVPRIKDWREVPPLIEAAENVPQ